MKKSNRELISMFFGKTPAIRFKRLMILTGVLIFAIIMIQNIGFKIDKDGFSFQWQPAAEIKIEKN